MNVRNIKTKENVTKRGYLYRLVFSTNYASGVVLLLLVSFLLQPIERAYANEASEPTSVPLTTEAEVPSAEETPKPEEATAESSEQITVLDEESEPLIEVAVDNASLLLPADSEITATTSSETETEEEIPTTPSVSEETVPLVSPEQIEETIALYTDENTDEETTPTEDSSGNVIDPVPVPEIIEPTEIEPTATSTILAESAIAVSTVSSDGMIQFDKSDCVTVADGSFYCQPKKSAEELAGDGLFALPDRDGDLEIYIQKSGELTQITFNEVDDAAPYFDALTNTIVWHRLVNDRYQIVSYDVEEAAETMLTSDTVNNMEPTKAGKYTVWQRWSGDNWDIVLYDGKNSTILTTALEHDIAPKVRGSLVVWNRLSFDRTQTIELYDIETGEYTSISDREGGTISNPRMVLVYESTFENGDIITKGYDIETGEIAPLNATPVEIPEEIPTPDSTGETRALIQGKTTTKEEAESFAIGTSTSSGPSPEPNLSGTTTTTTSAEQIASSTTVFATSSTAALELTIDMRPSEDTPVPIIDDIVVPQFEVEATTTLSDVIQ